MPQFLFWCAFEHLDFRLPEFEAIAELFNINLKWIDRNQSHPWVIIELDSIKGQLISKCLLGVIGSTKKPTNFFKDFCPSL